MATWAELSRESLSAAKLLLDRGLWRSCVSRAYYAVYAALTGELRTVKGVVFRHANNNPSHEQLPDLVEHHLSRRRFTSADRRELKRAAANLRMARIEADYSPVAGLDHATARDAVRTASVALRRLGVTP